VHCGFHETFEHALVNVGDNSWMLHSRLYRYSTSVPAVVHNYVLFITVYVCICILNCRKVLNPMAVVS